MTHDVAGLTAVDHLGFDEVLEAAGDFIGDTVKQINPLVGAQGAPLARQCRASRRHRRVNFRPTGLANTGHHGVVER